MAGQTVIILSDASRKAAHRLVDKADTGAAVTVLEKGLTRTASQNRTIHLWFAEVARQKGDTDASEVKGMCHRKWGLGIRLRDPKFAWIWERSASSLPYEKQCSLLASGVFNVSSGMTVAELSEYMDGMSRHFRAEGIELTDPDNPPSGVRP